MGIFDQAALQKAVEAELAIVPPNKTTALVGYVLLSGAWRVSYVRRIGDHWDLGAVLEGDLKAGRIQGGVQVRASW